MIIRGFGLGAVTMPVMVASYIGLDKQQIPHSSVLTRTAQQIGGSFGTAVLAVILEGATVRLLPSDSVSGHLLVTIAGLPVTIAGTYGTCHASAPVAASR